MNASVQQDLHFTPVIFENFLKISRTFLLIYHKKPTDVKGLVWFVFFSFNPFHLLLVIVFFFFKKFLSDYSRLYRQSIYLGLWRLWSPRSSPTQRRTYT